MKNIKIYYAILLNFLHRFEGWHGSYARHRRHDVFNWLIVGILHLKIVQKLTGLNKFITIIPLKTSYPLS